VVRRNVAARLPDVPTGYLHDEYALLRWNALGGVLDQLAPTPGLLDPLVHAAHDAIRCSLDWYVSEQALRHGA
jgi:hypothetical protein